MTLQRYAVRDVADLYDGPHATPAPANDGPVFLGIGNITPEGRLALSDVRHIAEEEFARWTRRVLPGEGDLVFTYEATLHRYAMIPAGFRGCLGRRTALLRLTSDEVHGPYLLYYFLSPIWRAQVERNIIPGATVERIPLTRVPDFTLDLPHVTEQRRIADVLSAYDDLIAANERRIALLEESVHLLYREWFERLRFPGHEWTPRVDSTPEHWSYVPLARVAEVNPASVDRRHPPATIRYVDISSLGRGRVAPNDEMPWGEAPSRAQRLASDGDVLWAMVRPANRAYAIVDTPPENLIVSTGIAVLSPRRVPTSYLYAATTTEHFVSHIAGVATGASYPAAKPGDFEDARILLPTPEMLESFDAFAGPCLRLISALERQNARLRQARDYLLPRLMSGQLTA